MWKTMRTQKTYHCTVRGIKFCSKCFLLYSRDSFKGPFKIQLFCIDGCSQRFRLFFYIERDHCWRLGSLWLVGRPYEGLDLQVGSILSILLGKNRNFRRTKWLEKKLIETEKGAVLLVDTSLFLLRLISNRCGSGLAQIEVETMTMVYRCLSDKEKGPFSH